VFGEAVERLRGLVPEAVDVLHARMNEGSDLAATRLLRLARLDRFQPEVENECPEPDHLSWDEPLHDRYPATTVRQVLPPRPGRQN
jgi:hypothetical protein